MSAVIKQPGLLELTINARIPPHTHSPIKPWLNHEDHFIIVLSRFPYPTLGSLSESKGPVNACH